MTIVAEDLRDSLALGGVWEERGGSYWIIPESASPRANGGRDACPWRPLHHHHRVLNCPMTAASASIITGISKARLFTFTFLPAGSSIESIYDLCEAADWIEREVHEYFAIEFAGRDTSRCSCAQGQEARLLNLRARRTNEIPDPYGTVSSGTRRALQARPGLRGENASRMRRCASASTSAASSTWRRHVTTSRSSR